MGAMKRGGVAGVPSKSRSTWGGFGAYGMIIPRCFWIYWEHQPPRAFCYTG